MVCGTHLGTIIRMAGGYASTPRYAKKQASYEQQRLLEPRIEAQYQIQNKEEYNPTKIETSITYGMPTIDKKTYSMPEVKQIKPEKPAFPVMSSYIMPEIPIKKKSTVNREELSNLIQKELQMKENVQ